MFKLLLAFIFCLGVGYYGHKKRIIDVSGLIASLLIGVIILVSLPLIWFFPLLALFVIGGFTAKYKWAYKKKYGVAEKKKGRSASNILGNGLVPLISAVLFYFFNKEFLLYAYICSIATACADSVATEIGQLSRNRPVLITNFKPARTGTDGAVSLLGEISALLASVSIAIIPFVFFGFFGNWNLKLFFISVVAGFVGCQFDSLIGATLERRIGSNHVTNFLATLSGALVGICLWLVF